MADTNEAWVKTILAGCLAVSSAAAVELAKGSASGASALTTAVNVLGVAAGVTTSLAVSEVYTKINLRRSAADLERNHYIRRGMAQALRAALLRAKSDESLEAKAGAAAESLFDAWPKLLGKANQDVEVLETLFPLTLAEGQWELLLTYAASREFQWRSVEETEAERVEALNARDADALIQILNGIPSGLDTRAAELPGRWSTNQAHEFALAFLPLYRTEFACLCAGDGVLGKAVQFKGITDIRSRLESLERVWRSGAREINDHTTIEAEKNRRNEQALHEITRHELKSEIAALASTIQHRRGDLNTTQEHHYHLDEMEVVFGYGETIQRLAQEWLSDANGRLLVYGPPAAGKSTLARAVLRSKSVRERFGKRRFELRCDDASNFEDLMARGAWVWFGILAERPQVAFNLMNSELEKEPCAVLLDNFETLLKGDPETQRKSREWLVRLGGADGVKLIIGVQGMAPPEGMAWPLRYQPEGLSLEECKALFCNHSQMPGHASDPRLPTLIEDVQRIPLAVKLLGKAALDQADLKLLEMRWAKQGVGLFMKPGEGRQECLDAAFDFAYAHLTLPMQEALRVLAWLPSGVAQAHQEMVLADGLEADHALYAAGVANRGGDPQRMTLLAPLREYVRIRHAANAKERSGAETFYLRLAAEMADPGVAITVEQIASFKAELENVRAALESALNAGRQEAIPAALGLMHFGDVVGLRQEASVTMLQRAEALANGLGSPRDEAWCLWSLAEYSTQWWQGLDTKEANYEAAYKLFAGRDLRGQAWCLVGMGGLAVLKQKPLPPIYDHIEERYILRRLFSELANKFDTARSIFANIHDLGGEARCVLQLANLSTLFDLLDHAERCATEAKRLYARAKDARNEAWALLHLAEVALKQERWKAAMGRYKRAQIHFVSFGDRRGEASCLFGLGQVTRKLHQSEASRSYYELSRKLGAALEDRAREAYCFCGLGEVEANEHNYIRAKTHFRAAQEMFQLAGKTLEAEWCKLQIDRL